MRVDLEQIRRWTEAREAELAPLSLRAVNATRAEQDPECDLRSAYQRDRDRIVHSTAFRRLKHKSQVLIAPVGDHYTTRLTHVIEVSQVGRTIARALKLNEDMVEAATLGHDLGHTPFGHVGEKVLNELLDEGFHHSQHSVRIVEHLGRNGRGLNLTRDVVDAIAKHSKPQGAFVARDAVADMSLEAQIVRMADAIAYLAHDILDAVRTGFLQLNDFPQDVLDYIGRRHPERINNILRDVITNSWDCSQPVRDGVMPWIRMSGDMVDAITTLRDFMFENFYLPVSDMEAGKRAEKLVKLILEYLIANPAEIPAQSSATTNDNERQLAVDYLCGMSDNFALKFAEKVAPGSSEKIAFN
jgi:dGTPase